MNKRQRERRTKLVSNAKHSERKRQIQIRKKEQEMGIIANGYGQMKRASEV